MVKYESLSDKVNENLVFTDCRSDVALVGRKVDVILASMVEALVFDENIPVSEVERVCSCFGDMLLVNDVSTICYHLCQAKSMIDVLVKQHNVSGFDEVISDIDGLLKTYGS